MKRIITCAAARRLRVGTKLLLLDFATKDTRSSYEKRLLLSFVVSPSVAKKEWGLQFNLDDVWYWYPDGRKSRSCYTMVGLRVAHPRMVL